MIKLTVIKLFIFLTANPTEGFNSFNLYNEHGAMTPWASFAKIGLSLAVAGYIIGLAVTLNRAISGEGNVPQIVLKLILSGIGLFVIQKLI